MATTFENSAPAHYEHNSFDEYDELVRQREVMESLHRIRYEYHKSKQETETGHISGQDTAFAHEQAEADAKNGLLLLTWLAMLSEQENGRS